ERLQEALGSAGVPQVPPTASGPTPATVPAAPAETAPVAAPAAPAPTAGPAPTAPTAVSPPTGATPGAPQAGEGARMQRRLMGLLFFESRTDPVNLKNKVERFFGRLGRVTGNGGVAVFGLGGDGNPVEQALRAARALSRDKVLGRAVVDFGAVSVQ